MKRLLCLIAIIALICAMIPVATAENEVYLRLAGGNGNVGETVEVELNIENAPECSGFEVIFQYDDKVLEFVSGDGVDISGLFMCSKTTYGGKPAVKCNAAASGECLSGSGTLATVVFRIIGETEGKFGTPLTICYKPFFPVDASQGAFAPEPKHGRVYVGADEPLSTGHAVEILRHRVGTPSQNAADLDWDGDGRLTIADATLVLRELN